MIVQHMLNYCNSPFVTIFHCHIIQLSLYLFHNITGSGQSDPDRDDAPGDGDDVGLDQQLAAAGRLHEGHRRLVGGLRLLRL